MYASCHQECVLGEAKISELALNNIKTNAQDWKGVGRFADIYDRTLWDSKTEFYVHNNCKIQIATKKKLGSARSRLTNSKDLNKEIPSTSCSIDDNDTKGKRWKRSLGPLHRPELCIWCLKPQDKSHGDRKTSSLHLIDHKNSWDQLRAHTVHLDDEELRSRILSFIDSCHDPYADLLLSLINGKRTLFKTQLAITIHDLTRNKELVQLLHKFGLDISYNDTIDLESTWAYHENQVSQVCPKELAYGYPGIAVIDDDDFREDTLTGGRTSHRTNMMFVQPVKLVMSVESQEALIIPTKKQRTEMAASQTSVEAYHTHRRGNPLPHPEYNTTLHDDTQLQRNRWFAHAIVREIPSNTDASDQMIGAYSGFQALLEDNQDKNQA